MKEVSGINKDFPDRENTVWAGASIDTPKGESLGAETRLSSGKSFVSAGFSSPKNLDSSIKRVFVPAYNTAMLGITGQRFLETRKTEDAILAGSFAGILAGDLALLGHKEEIGVPMFALSHLGLGTYFTIDNGGFRATDAFTLIPVAIVGGAIIYDNLSYAKSHPEFVIYLAILSFMLWRALGYMFNDEVSGLKRFLAVTGASLFYTVDIMVGLEMIYNNDLSKEIWSIYPPALLMIALSNRV